MAGNGVPSWYWPNENYGLRVADDGTVELVALNGVIALSILPDGTLVGGNLNLKELLPGVDPHDAATVSQLGSGPGGNGATGATGPAGASGPPGSPGSVGATGATGPAGNTGASGAGGGAGATGATGPGGSAGGQGATGATGSAGSAGAAGATGATGPDWLGWTTDAANPANVASNGGALTVGQFVATPPSSEVVATLVRPAYVGSPTLSGHVPYAEEVRDQNGNLLYFIDAFGGIDVQHNVSWPAPPDGVFLNQMKCVSLSEDGSFSECYFLGMGAMVFGGSLYGQVGSPWKPLTAVPYGHATTKATPDGKTFFASVAGTTGASEPVWPAAFGDTVVDGTVTWFSFDDTPGNTPFVFYGPKNNDGVTVVPNRVRVFEVWREQSGSLPSWGIGPNGEEQLFVTAAPDDGEVVASSRSQWYTDDVGFPKLNFKERDSSGTLSVGYAAAFNDNDVLKQRNLSATDAAAALGSSQYTSWLEDAVGAPLFHIVAKDSAGTLFGASIPLGAL